MTLFEVAIEHLKRQLSPNGINANTEDISMAVTALEKQTPQMVIYQFRASEISNILGDCPSCERFVGSEWTFCPWCGQALKWNKKIAYVMRKY